LSEVWLLNFLRSFYLYRTFYNMLQHFTKIRLVRKKSLNHNRCKTIRKQGETHFVKIIASVIWGPLHAQAPYNSVGLILGLSDPKCAILLMRSPLRLYWSLLKHIYWNYVVPP
jgi:hypothetical protein